ncbi:MAG: hypothetical protein ICV64_02425 [Thermoleophilia bacterium]|nr:hypothetical protein [Thermoleophilia bacterium]
MKAPPAGGGARLGDLVGGVGVARLEVRPLLDPVDVVGEQPAVIAGLE